MTDDRSDRPVTDPEPHRVDGAQAEPAEQSEACIEVGEAMLVHETRPPETAAEEPEAAAPPAEAAHASVDAAPAPTDPDAASRGVFADDDGPHEEISDFEDLPAAEPATEPTPPSDGAIAAPDHDGEPPAPDLGPPGPAPERAHRRVRRGVRIATRIGALSAAAALLPLGVATLAALDVEPAAAKAASLELPPAPDLSAVSARLSSLAAEVARLQKGELERSSMAMLSDLEREVPVLYRQIATARDARREDGKKGKDLRVPFDAEELGPAFAQLGVGNGRGRFITDREGTIIAPTGEGTELDLDLDLTAPGTDAATLNTRIEGEDGRFTVVARTCVPKEQHCLLEIGTFLIEAPSVQSELLALEGVTSFTAATRAAVSSSAAAPADAELGKKQMMWLGLAFLLAIALLALVSRALQHTLTRPLARLGGRMRLIAAGQLPERDGAASPAEIEEVQDAADAVARRVAEIDIVRTAERQRTMRLSAIGDAIADAARGDLSVRAPVEGETTERALAHSVNRLLESLERQLVRIRSHAQCLQPHDDDATEDGPSALAQRAEALRPIAALLADIASRLQAHASNAAEVPSLQFELDRLASAVAGRAGTARTLVDNLVAEVDATPGPTRAGLGPDEAEALEALVADIDALGIDTSFPTLFTALRDLDPPQLAARLARDMPRPAAP